MKHVMRDVMVALFVLSLSAGCGGGALQGSSGSTVVSEDLPLPDYDPEAAQEAPDDSINDESCQLPVEDPSAEDQIRVFRRWLSDQSVGRHLDVVEVTPLCGDREGSLVFALILEGPAGGLDSMTRALSSYYPGSAFDVERYERLRGANNPLRIHAQIFVPVGAEPVPRCVWDPASCPDQQPPSDEPEPTDEQIDE